MKKILIISLVGFGFDGITTVIYNYCSHMDRSAVLLSFVIFPDTEPDFIKKFSKLGTVELLPNRKEDFQSYLRGLNTLLQQKHYDGVHIHGNSGTMVFEVIMARLHGIQKIMVHAHNTNCDHPIISKVSVPVMKALSTDLLACSAEAGKWLYGNSPYMVLSNAIDVEKYHFDEEIRKACRQEFGVGDSYLIGHVGKFVEAKNHAFLLEVFREYLTIDPQSKLLLVSDESKQTEIREKARALSVENSVLLTYGRTDIQCIYNAMDLFVLPSLHEGLPLVMLEGQASGLPMLVSDSVTQEAKCSDSVIYKPLADGVTSWAKAIATIKSNNRIRKNNVNSIKERGFDIDNEAARLLSIYKSDIG